VPTLLEHLDLAPPVRDALREARDALRQMYGSRLQRLVVFGSQARGEAGEDSDIDLLVVLNGPVNAHEEARRTSDLVIDVAIHHGVALSIVHLSADEFADTGRSFVQNVQADGVEL
jgi:predicted nucleotidyltransferase